MRRRQVLAGGALLLSVSAAGCGHPSVVLDLDEASADDITDEVSITAERGSEEYRVVVAARENGSTTRSGQNDLFDRDDTVRVENAFYEVTETGLDSTEATVYDVVIDFDPDNSTPERGDIAYGDLPETDRQRLERIVTEGATLESGPGRTLGTGYGTAAAVGNESVFVPEPQYDVLVYEGERYRVTVDSRIATETEYRYEVTEIASDAETLADRVRADYLFALTDLSEDERAVVEEAIGGGYFEENDAFRSVIDRIRDHDGIDVADFYGTWLLEFEDVEYLTYAEW